MEGSSTGESHKEKSRFMEKRRSTSVEASPEVGETAKKDTTDGGGSRIER